MKILVINELYPPHYLGSYELICQEVVDGLKKFGHEFSILTTTFGVDKMETVGNVHRNLHFLLRSHKNVLHKRVSQITDIVQANQNYKIAHQLIKEESPDFVFTWNLKFTSLSPAYAAMDLGCPIVFQFGGHWFSEAKSELKSTNLLQKFYRSGMIGFRNFDDLKIEAGIFVAEHLMKDHFDAGIKINRPVVIPNSIPDEWVIDTVNEFSPDENVTRLLYIGRFTKDKGTDIVVYAVDHLINNLGYKNVICDLIGEGDPVLENDLKHFIADRGLENHIKFYGFMPRSELIQHIQNYDILLFPTPKWEGMPVAIIEAMARGLAVISSNIKGPDEIIEHQKDGLLIPPNDPVEMGRAIDLLLKSPSFTNELKKAAIETVKNKFVSSKMIESYQDFISLLVTVQGVA